jgi:hypothetical protein
MTTAVADRIESYAENGVTVNFPVPFKFLANTEVQAMRRLANGTEVPLALGVDYTLTGAGDPAGGTLTVLVVSTATTLLLWGETGRSQQTDYETGDRFPAESHERALDRLDLVNQEQDREIARTLRVPRGEAGLEMLTAAERASKFLAFDVNGSPVASAGTGVDAGLREDLAAESGSALVGFKQSDAGAVVRQMLDRLRDTVNIKDFGAVGDDTANDTAAFAAAAATGRPVMITEGTYRVAGCLFTARVYFQGGKIRRTGGTLAFSGGIDAAPGNNIFLDAVYPNIDINNDLTPEGWVDWFGYDADAIETCHKIFHVNRLGPRDYFIDRTVILDQSYREVIGSRGSAEGSGGTRILMNGSAVANQPVIQVGTLNTGAVLSCARRLNIRYINTFRNGAVDPSTDSNRTNAVPGWKVAGLYEGAIEECFDFNSPIHFRVYGTIACFIRKCGGVRITAGSVNGFPDYYTAFCLGGDAASFGFIGANASLTIDQCGTSGGVGTDRMGIYLFGYIGDTWIYKFEDSQLEYGAVIDGNTSTGGAIASPSAHQDVRFEGGILDAMLANCITVQNINAGGAVEVGGRTYCALNAAGDAVLVNNCKGLVSLESLDIIAHSGLANYGVRIAGSKRVTASEAVHIKDCRVGLKAESSGQLSLRPTITRANVGGTNAVEISGVGRSIVQPIIDSDVAAFDYGIVSDSGTNYCEFNITGVNYGCFTTVSAGRKIWHNGASWGGGGTFGTSNIATGVLG